MQQRSTVAQMPEHLLFISDSQDTQELKAQLGDTAAPFDGFFVGDVQDGWYSEVWGMCGIVPRLSKTVTRLV